ncbi:MAG: redoxin domain-containing protein, partial [Pseudohongiella sp.]|nr:redoxin domain-containing protein [Pseudohongiella sp.]
MKKLFVLLLLLYGLTPSVLFACSVPDFALIDQNGRFYQLSRFVDQRAIVILVFQRDSEAGQTVLPELVSLSRRYQGAPVQFMALVADSSESRETLRQLAAELDTDLPFLLDETQLISDALDITSVAEVLVIDPLRLTLLYRGGVGLFSNSPAQQALAANLPGMTSHLHYVVHSILRNENFTADGVAVAGTPLVLE